MKKPLRYSAFSAPYALNQWLVRVWSKDLDK